MKHFILLLLSLTCINSCKDSNKTTSTTNLSANFSESIANGKDIYTDFCMTCHMPDGKGVPKSFPPLANSDYLKNNRLLSIKAVKYGLSDAIEVNGETYNMPMASLGLSDAEIADVMNYITNSWGNQNSEMITVKEVSEIKP